MNRKQFQILVAVGLVLGGYGLFVLRSQRDSYKISDATSTQKVLPTFPLNEIERVRIKQSSGEVNLEKSDELWRVKERSGYLANFSEISDLLRKVWELKPVREEKVGESQLARLQLVAPDKGTNSATLVEFQDKSGKVLQALLLGKNYTRNSGDASPMGGGVAVGRYVLVPEPKPAKVFLVGETFANLETKPETWINKDFFKIEKIKSVSVTSTNGTSWTLTRDKEGGELKLADAKADEVLDQAKAGGPGNVFGFPSFTDVSPASTKPEETGLNHPTIAKITTFENFAYTVQIGLAPTGEDHSLTLALEANLPKERIQGADEKPEDKDKLDKEFKDGLVKLEAKLKTEKSLEKWVFLVPKYVVDPLLKDRKDFFADKVDSKQPPGGINPLGAPGLPPGFPGIDDIK